MWRALCAELAAISSDIIIYTLSFTASSQPLLRLWPLLHESLCNPIPSFLLLSSTGVVGMDHRHRFCSTRRMTTMSH
jgi:hypothetical protein